MTSFSIHPDDTELSHNLLFFCSMDNKEAAKSLSKKMPTLLPIPVVAAVVGSSGEIEKRKVDAPATLPTGDNKKPLQAGKDSSGGGKQEKKELNKGSGAAAPSATPAGDIGAADADPSNLDLRVGLISKCWNHPDSEKLLCEEIDVGEENVRSVASGLRSHYKAEEMVGRKVIVVCNLKDAKMGGFKSQGEGMNERKIER